MSRKWKHLHQEIEDDLDELSYYDDCNDGTERNKDLIFNYVKEANISQFRRCLDRGWNINVNDVYQRTPLHIAAGLILSDASKEIMYLLISFGCQLEAQDRFGQTALHIASTTFADYVQMLLDAGCNVNSQDNAGMTPLMLACQSTSPQMLNIVQYLMDRGANIHMKDLERQTALHAACRYIEKQDISVKTELVYKLLYAGSDVNAENIQGNTPAYMSLESTRMNENESPRLTEIRPLVRAGAKYLENTSLMQEMILNEYKGHFLPLESEVNVTLYLLDLCGKLCRLTTFRNIRNFVGNLENPSRFHKTVLDKLNSRLQSVESLKLHSRVVIRESLQNKIFLNVHKLNIPNELVKYITYSECV